MTEAELLLRRAAYCRDLARTDAEQERLGHYLDGLEAEALAFERQAAE